MATKTAATRAPLQGSTLQVGALEMFYVDAPGGTPPLLLLHGLSSNAHAFGGLLGAGLSPAFRVIAPDQRGRARTSKPASGYTMADHAADVVSLLDALRIERVVLGGHSFGGYLAIYIAANYPQRVEKLVVMDAAITSHPRIPEMLKPSLERLTRTMPSTDDYLASIRVAPYMNGLWDDYTYDYFRAEIAENADGTVRSATDANAIAQAAAGIALEPWLHHVQSVTQPAILLNALDSYGPPGFPPLMDEVVARATARAFPNCQYQVVPGNHLTMLFGRNAFALADAIETFVRA